MDWMLTPQAAFAIEAVHFAVGDAIRQVGGRNSDYLGVETRLMW
jgi:hypothetical protein